MGWWPCGGCVGGTPCFCTGSFTDFQVTFSGVAYNSWTFNLSTTLCAPIGGAGHINGTHTIAAGAQSNYYCTAVETLDGGSLGDATKPVQRLREVPSFGIAPGVFECDCYTPPANPCPGGFSSCFVYTCFGPAAWRPYSTWYNETYVRASINYDGSDLILRVYLGWPEVYQFYSGTSYSSWIVNAAYAIWEKTIAVTTCTSINETLTKVYEYQGICDTFGYFGAGGPCFALAGDGTYDFSGASCSLALV